MAADVAHGKHSHLLIEVGIGAVVLIGALLFVSHSSNAAKPGAAPKPGWSEQFLSAITGQQASVDTASLAAQSSTKVAAYSYGATVNQDAAALSIAQVNGASALSLANVQLQIAKVAQQIAQTSGAQGITQAEIQANAATTIANYLKQANINAANQAANASQAASHAQQQSSFWGSLAGIISSIGAIFGV